MTVKVTNHSMMKLAIKEAKISKSSHKDDPKVGAILVLPNGEIFKGYRGENRTGDHAEYTVLEKTEARNMDITGSTLFTTLEPCTTRNHPKIPCAQRILDGRIGKVWIGMLDPNPDVYAKGLRMLEQGGVDWDFFPKILRDDLKDLNIEFINKFARQSVVELSDYWSVAILKEANYFKKKEMSTLLWGEKSGTTFFEVQYQLMEEARKSGEISDSVMSLDSIFPRYSGYISDSGERAVGVRAVTLEALIPLHNPSKASPIIFFPCPSSLQYSDKNWLRHGLLLNIEISFQQKLITLQPGSFDTLPIKVKISLKEEGIFLSLETSFEKYLVAGQAFKHWLVSGIESLTFQLQLNNGEKISKEFGLRLDEQSRSTLEKIEVVEVKKCLEILSKICEWTNELTKERRRKHMDIGYL